MLCAGSIRQKNVKNIMLKVCSLYNVEYEFSWLDFNFSNLSITPFSTNEQFILSAYYDEMKNMYVCTFNCRSYRNEPCFSLNVH
jgi:hypothetical protein